MSSPIKFLLKESISLCKLLLNNVNKNRNTGSRAQIAKKCTQNNVLATLMLVVQVGYRNPGFCRMFLFGITIE
jgi:hypothetical protein